MADIFKGILIGSHIIYLISMRLNGKVAIVTGSSRGIGQAIALRLAKEGARVVVNSRKLDGTEETVNLIKKAGGTAVGIAADVSDAKQVQSLVSQAVKRFGRLDIMVNNAGVADEAPLTKMTTEEWNSMIAVDLTGVFLGVQAAAKAMKNGGAIVNTSSIAALVGFPQTAHYSAAKGGVRSLTQEAAVELGPKIRVNAVAPGIIDTEMTKSIKEDPAQLKAMMGRITLKRLGKPEDIANAVAFLASDEASYITGQLLIVDGGWMVD
jgi:NAD(P)-dependent dehydrogenase (short-subunit alcohol dehydrogenase family)